MSGPSLQRSADAIDLFFAAIICLAAFAEYSRRVFHNSDEFRTNEKATRQQGGLLFKGE